MDFLLFKILEEHSELLDDFGTELTISELEEISKKLTKRAETEELLFRFLLVAGKQQKNLDLMLFDLSVTF